MEENINMRLDSFEIVDYYFKVTNTQRGLSNFSYYTNVVIDLLNKGISRETIMKNIAENKSLIIEKEKKKENDGHNLIVGDTFYYHPFLRLPTPAPRAEQDPVTGEITTTYIESLGFKNSITIESVLEYMYECFELTDSTCNIKRDIGSLKHLLKNNIAEAVRLTKDNRVNGLDLLLFTIDTARWNIYDGDIKVNNILQIVDYIGEAMNIYREKITQYSYLNG